MLFIFPCHGVEINRNRCRFHAFSIIIKPDVPTLAIAIIFFLVKRELTVRNRTIAYTLVIYIISHFRSETYASGR